MRFAYPPQTAFGRVIPKAKIYAAAKASAKTQALFVAQVTRLVWQNKLATETLNLPATNAVPEVQVLRLEMRGPRLDDQVLATIDKAIPLPLIFEVVRAADPAHPSETVATMAAHKRPNAADPAKWVTSAYLWGPWEEASAARLPLPQALDLEVLYTRLLRPLLAHSMGEAVDDRALHDAPLADQIAAAEAIEKQRKRIVRLRAKVRTTRQFNKQVAINADLRQALKDLKMLKCIKLFG